MIWSILNAILLPVWVICCWESWKSFYIWRQKRKKIKAGECAYFLHLGVNTRIKAKTYFCLLRAGHEGEHVLYLDLVAEA